MFTSRSNVCHKPTSRGLFPWPAFTKTDPAVGRESAVGEDQKGPAGSRLPAFELRVHSIVPKADNEEHSIGGARTQRFGSGGDVEAGTTDRIR